MANSEQDQKENMVVFTKYSTIDYIEIPLPKVLVNWLFGITVTAQILMLLSNNLFLESAETIMQVFLVISHVLKAIGEGTFLIMLLYGIRNEIYKLRKTIITNFILLLVFQLGIAVLLCIPVVSNEVMVAFQVVGTLSVLGLLFLGGMLERFFVGHLNICGIFLILYGLVSLASGPLLGLAGSYIWMDLAKCLFAICYLSHFLMSIQAKSE